MQNTKRIMRVTLFALLLGAVASVPVLAGSAVIGSVAGSLNASVGGQVLLPNTTIFSGDSLQVRDGVAVISIGKESRVVLGRETVGSFLMDANVITFLLTQGNVSVLHATEAPVMRVKAQDVTVSPGAGFRSLGEIAMVNGAVVVTSKEGSLQVDDRGTARTVTQGQTMVIAPKNRNKQGGGAGWGGGVSVFQVATLGAATTGAILAGLSIAWADDATNAANSATLAANSANATAAAAIAAANAAAAAANAVGCALSAFENSQGMASTYFPPTGFTCP